jgi:hypothetical protein
MVTQILTPPPVRSAGRRLTALATLQLAGAIPQLQHPDKSAVCSRSAHKTDAARNVIYRYDVKESRDSDRVRPAHLLIRSTGQKGTTSRRS